MNIPNEELLNRRIHQFLVHSFLYYKLNENIISDSEYDKLCKELVQLKQSVNYKNHKYTELVEKLDASGSGYYISNYPNEIISRSLLLLFKYKNTKYIFQQFVNRYGYRVGDVECE